jgi:1,4-dihydroxy-2-naphthoyl-CoA hydrolase
MSIWFHPFTPLDLQQRSKGTMVEHLGIEFTEVGDNFLSGTMPVDHRTVQPMGLLHGGASIALAETLGSMAANYVVNPDTHYCVGLDINGNHLRAVRSGKVTGTAIPLHLGTTTQVWNVEIRDEEGLLVCISRLTMAVLVRK